MKIVGWRDSARYKFPGDDDIHHVEPSIETNLSPCDHDALRDLLVVNGHMPSESFEVIYHITDYEHLVAHYEEQEIPNVQSPTPLRLVE